ncbi:hypothetical protein FA15DRAFT_667030 [Coprinopsis marcescibilis]|uniref:Peptidase M43 pregnancy-associated plasma-A domain-containing protein n=1 Tax=Coprinopsis marcescibilis TaxID=230819 RepID=A0A5C3L1Z3_COPMA|nr:hypothetical protein FA15DRAFT_667030 [Coprinopsis marcescibilis]
MGQVRNSTDLAGGSVQPISRSNDCGTRVFTPKEAAQQEEQFRTLAQSKGVTSQVRLLRSQPFVVPLYYHVVYESETFAGGYLTDTQIHAAVSLLNEGFSTSGMEFRLDGIQRHHNPTWFRLSEPNSDGWPHEWQMKTQTKIGGMDTLNVWTNGMNLAAGYARYPWDNLNGAVDGVVMKYDVIPGNGNQIRSGKSLTHEVGHWAGLYHTFDGGCTGNGDFVADTAAQGTATDFNGCHPRDTCPGQPGEDPVENFMDYSSDQCRNHFTWGQIDRMWTTFSTYRV